MNNEWPARVSGLGGSDAAEVFGADPRFTLSELYAMKTGALPEDRIEPAPGDEGDTR